MMQDDWPEELGGGEDSSGSTCPALSFLEFDDDVPDGARVDVFVKHESSGVDLFGDDDLPALASDSAAESLEPALDSAELDGHYAYLSSVSQTSAPKRLVRQMQYDEMKRMRNMNRSIQNEKKKRSFVRAVKTSTKQERQQTKRAKMADEDRFVRPPIESAHEERADLLEYELSLITDDEDEYAECSTRLKVYMRNYYNWTLMRSKKLTAAQEADAAEMEEDVLQDEEVELARLRGIWSAAFLPTLLILGVEVAHGSGGKMRVFKKKATGAGILGYMKRKPGDRARRVELAYRRYYYERVVEDTLSDILTWPDPRQGADGFMVEVETGIEADAKQAQLDTLSGLCKSCKIPMVENTQHGCWVCHGCGASVTGGAISMKVTFDQMQSCVRGALPYDRMAHVSIRSLLACGALGGWPVHGVIR
jgi:hypothetical protein